MSATKKKSPGRKKSSLWLALTIGGLSLLAAVSHFVASDKARVPKTTHAAAPELESDKSLYAKYAGSASCRECHEEAYAAWTKSHHAQAERLPDPREDDAAFVPPRTFRHGTQQTSVRGTNGHYEVVTAGLSGTNEVFPVERIFAENPLRQMLVPFPGGRLQATEAAWDLRSNQWFNVYGAEDRKPGEWGHWTGRGMNWNSMCATCHNTRVRKNYDAVTDTYHTTMAERGVGCESCHGPMKAHNDWQHAHKNSGLKDPTLHTLTRDDMFNTCAGCHSRREEITEDTEPGETFLDHHLLTIVDGSQTFYPDGQISEEDYEVTAFMGSRMFHGGVRCVDCHDVHTMKTRLPGNFLCLQCHGPGATNAPAINPTTHSHHKVFGFDTNGVLVSTDLSRYKPELIKETGGECVNCHMPQTVYMQRHWRHDHGFTIPDPLLTKQFNIPNACERCHADKGTDWNLKYVEQWYGTNMNRPYRQRAQTVALARRGDEKAVLPLIQMFGTDNSFYWRAVAANLLQPWCAETKVMAALSDGLKNTNALVREMSVSALAPLAQAGNADVTAMLKSMLPDPSRNVRIEAARQLTAVLDTNSPAGRDYLQYLAHMADQPSGQMQMGNFELQRGNLTNALAHFQTAAKWDSYSPAVHHQVALVLSQLGRHEQAVQEMQKAVTLAPLDAEYHYALGLAWNEVGDSRKLMAELEAALKLDPRHARAGYNLGLARNAAGDPAGALQALLTAEAADPRDPRIPYARATIYAQLGQRNEAIAAARRALELDPHFDQATALLEHLR